MFTSDPTALLQSLDKVQWSVATRTFGSSHATLIGLISSWWIGLSPNAHSVLDGAPSYGSGNAGWCDLMLCCDDKPLGVVEVEGTKPLGKICTLSAYFSSNRQEFASIWFGLLLVYAYGTKGKGAAKQYPPAETPEVIDAARMVSATYPAKALAIVALDKIVDVELSAVRRVSPYYAGSCNRVTASVFMKGKKIERPVLFENTDKIA